MAPPRRADARRNHELLLDAARRVFAERGPDAPLDEVARRAGVGNATMYRNFPTRRDLLVAVYEDEVTDLCARGEALLASDPPEDSLYAWLRAFVEHVSTKRDLALAIPDGSSDRVRAWHDAMLETGAALLDRAQRAGRVRADVTIRDLLSLTNAVALATADAGQTDRLLALLRRGAAR